MPMPERRIGGERQNVRQEIARAVHDLDGRFAIFHADVHVQAEDQIGARHHLHVLDDDAVAVVGVDFLIAPQARTGACRRPQSRRPFSRASVMICRRMERISPCASWILSADAGADLDHRLVHLRLDALGQQHLALLQRSRR